MDISKLEKLGLTKSESIIYSAMLKIGVSTVRDISKESGFHRTNIYDILEQLKEKGLITFFKEGKVSKYKVSDPQNLYAYLKEKEELLNSLFPEIEKLHNVSNDLVQVEIYKGTEGMKSAWRDMIKEKKEIYGFGVKGQLREKLPLFAEQWLRDAKNNKIK